MNKNYKITNEVFITVKTLIANGATYAFIKKICKISSMTISHINSAETFEDYMRITSEYSARKREEAKAKAKAKAEAEAKVKVLAEAKEKAQTPTSSSVTQYEMVRLFKEQNEYLKLISDKLAFIVEQLA